MALNDSVPDEFVAVLSEVLRIAAVKPEEKKWTKTIDYDLADRVMARLKAIHPEVFKMPINEIRPYMAQIENALLDPIRPCSWDLEMYSGLKNEGIIYKPSKVRNCYPKR